MWEGRVLEPKYTDNMERGIPVGNDLTTLKNSKFAFHVI